MPDGCAGPDARRLRRPGCQTAAPARRSTAGPARTPSQPHETADSGPRLAALRGAGSPANPVAHPAAATERQQPLPSAGGEPPPEGRQAPTPSQPHETADSGPRLPALRGAGSPANPVAHPAAATERQPPAPDGRQRGVSAQKDVHTAHNGQRWRGDFHSSRILSTQCPSSYRFARTKSVKCGGGAVCPSAARANHAPTTRTPPETSSWLTRVGAWSAVGRHASARSKQVGVPVTIRLGACRASLEREPVRERWPQIR